MIKSGSIGIANARYTVNVAYVIIPSNMERERYVQNCIRTNTIDCITETGDFIKDVFAAKGLISSIKFPTEKRKMGTAVVLVTIPKYSKCIAIAILPKGDEIEKIQENEFYFVSQTANGIVTLSGVGWDPGMYINIQSFTDEGGNLIIDVSNLSDTAKMKVNVRGDVEVFAEDDVIISAKRKIVAQILNNSGDQLRMITLNKDYVLLGAGSEPVLLGETTKQLLIDFIDEVAKCTTSTALGTMPILNAAQVAALKVNIDRILSEKVKTD